MQFQLERFRIRVHSHAVDEVVIEVFSFGGMGKQKNDSSSKPVAGSSVVPKAVHVRQGDLLPRPVLYHLHHRSFRHLGQQNEPQQQKIRHLAMS